MDRRRIELQIRAILVPYRIEQRRRNGPSMRVFRARARQLLDELEDAVRPYPKLGQTMGEARRELAVGEVLPGSGLGEEPVDGGGQFVDPERLR